MRERSKKLTPLRFKKLFQIKLPLKQKREYVPRIKRKHQSLKRDTDKNGKFEEKYPLLRRISLLLDNIITSESIEYENDKQQSITSAERDLLCPCARSSKADPAEATAASSTVTVTAHPLQSAMATKTPRPPTHHLTLGNLRSLRENQKLPLLPAGDTTSSKRNYHGIGKGSSAPRNWDLKRTITWNHRPGQHNTERETSETNAEVNDKYADVDTRNSTSGYRAFRRQLRSRSPTDSKRAPAARLLQRLENFDNPETSTVTLRETRGNVNQYQNENQQEIKRDEEKSPELIRRGLERSSEHTNRGFIPANQISHIGQPIQPNETDENRNIDVSQHLTGYQGVTNGNGTFTRENKGLRKENEAVISLNRSELVSFQNVPINKSVVVIIDGYSVTRSKTGENKFSEKSIRLQPVRDNSTGDIMLSFNNK